jgi:hypothetical protein
MASAYERSAPPLYYVYTSAATYCSSAVVSSHSARPRPVCTALTYELLLTVFLSQVIALNNGVTGNAWTYFGYLCLLCVCLRLAILLMCYYPLATITKAIKNLTTSKLHQVCNGLVQLSAV